MSEVNDAFLSGAEPPKWVVRAARAVAVGIGFAPPNEQPSISCHKSQRGVVLYNPELERHRIKIGNPFNVLIAKTIIAGTGRNGPPPPFTCDASDKCRERCNKFCVHAEDRAIREAGSFDDISDLELVHVKVVDDQVVPGGPPSCWQCSRTIVDAKIRGVWLLEVDRGWVYRSAEEFHTATLQHCGLAL